MKDVSGEFEYKGKKYKIVFNLNVMEAIQAEYGTVDKWGKLSDGIESGEIDAKAVKFGYTAMINEGIDIDNEENGTETKHVTLRQVGRMITDLGLEKMTETLNNTVIESTQSGEKNELSTTKKK